jgi:hypothetical protein
MLLSRLEVGKLKHVVRLPRSKLASSFWELGIHQYVLQIQIVCIYQLDFSVVIWQLAVHNFEKEHLLVSSLNGKF